MTATLPPPRTNLVLIQHKVPTGRRDFVLIQHKVSVEGELHTSEYEERRNFVGESDS